MDVSVVTFVWKKINSDGIASFIFTVLLIALILGYIQVMWSYRS